ncbi:cytochrome c biogenesis protein CcdA [Micromonospora sp. WMMD1102]|uniref:cytochrome c biogenesis CcdA family protein n=1 Tax=Micromonospora sp. WMMD1102 TaxID=3016105 RepID=UPI002415597F|nr:cytochrome c biogenesis protein CcdA [Micromonospora sp. WMMD1102]MDG4790600.1 cytochrome c biogenesis protein CcdA [Micromonospora sp. WMMD1102]
MGESFAELAESGPVLLAVGAAVLAGLVSFLSPCVLPLVPGYLSYVTGLAGSDLERRAAGTEPAPGGPAGSTGPGGSAGSGGGSGGVSGSGGAGAAPAGGGVAVAARAVRAPRAVRGRVLAGTLLFIAGFTAVFTLTAVLVTAVGQALFAQRRPLEIGIGVVIMVLGLAYLGLVPGTQREFRIRRLPAAGLLGAPVFGAVFALSWIPCVGPTLGAVVGMGTASGQADRAALLAVAYCLGLGLPFVVFGLGFSRLLGLFRAVRRNSRWVTRVGGALLIAIGLALVTGGWQDLVIWLQTTFGVGEVSI